MEIQDTSWRHASGVPRQDDTSWRRTSGVKLEDSVALPKYADVDIHDFFGGREAYFRGKRALRDTLSEMLDLEDFERDNIGWRSAPAIPKIEVDPVLEAFNIQHGFMHVTDENLAFFLAQIELYYGPEDARPQEESLIQLEDLRFAVKASVKQAFDAIQEEYPEFKQHILEIEEG